MAYKVSLTKFAKICAKLGDNAEAATIKGIQSAALRLEGIIPEAIQDTKPRAPNDTGQLLRSHFTELTERGAIVGVDAPHAPFIEYGTRPHMPPFGPLADWAYRKGLTDIEVTGSDLDEYLSREKLGSKEGLDLEDVDRALQVEKDKAIRFVLGVLRKIARDGLEPRGFMKRAVMRFKRRRIMDEEIQAELQETDLTR